jgi:uncharacterized membrane protein
MSHAFGARLHDHSHDAGFATVLDMRIRIYFFDDFLAVGPWSNSILCMYLICSRCQCEEQYGKEAQVNFMSSILYLRNKKQLVSVF